MNFKEIKELTKALSECNKSHAVNYTFSKDDGSNYTLSVEAINETLRRELFEKCGSRNGFEKNKYDLYELMAEEIDGKLPPELGNYFEGFTEIHQFGPSDAPEFTIRKDRKNLRARRFAVRGSSAGSYEVFRLSKENKLRVHMFAITDACQIAFEDFLSGRVDWNEMLNAVELGIADRIYDAILDCLTHIESKLPAANKGTGSTFDPSVLEKVLSTVGVYGTPTIFCTETFARAITEGSDWASEAEKIARRNLGYLAQYKGAKIVVLPQSFTDETNTTKVVDDTKAFVLPAGRGPIFYVALQGNTEFRDVDNEDWSIEIQAYKRVGVAALVYNDLGIVEFTSLA